MSDQVRIKAPITCRLLPGAPEPKDQLPGDMWLCPWLLKDGEVYEGDQHLSDQYRRETVKVRSPLIVALPGGGQWCVDNISSQDRAQGNRKGWKVTGEPPAITAHPSIQTHNWHGWLRNGVLTQA